MTESTAGRELDALIAEKVMGWKLDYEFADYLGAPTVPALRDQYDEWGMLPEFSTGISAAWRVVEKLKEKYRVSIHSWGDGWQCALEIKDGKPRYPGMDIAHDGDVHAEGEISEAICLAALKAIEATQKEKTL